MGKIYNIFSTVQEDESHEAMRGYSLLAAEGKADDGHPAGQGGQRAYPCLLYTSVKGKCHDSYLLFVDL